MPTLHVHYSREDLDDLKWFRRNVDTAAVMPHQRQDPIVQEFVDRVDRVMRILDKLTVKNDSNKNLRVWWIPQIPMEPFRVLVDSVEEAKKLLKVLANYDLFQFEHNIKPDYCNIGGLEEFDGKEWCDWVDESGDPLK